VHLPRLAGSGRARGLDGCFLLKVRRGVALAPD
jgi:hypothetical protein